MVNGILDGPRLPLAALLAATLGCGDLALPDISGANLELNILDGNGQTGPVGAPLPKPLVVKVVTETGHPVAGRQVAFLTSVDAGSLDPDTTETNERGEAVATWVLGTEPGQYTVEARLVAELEEPPAKVFQASAVPAAPDTLRPASPTNQPGRRGETLEEPLAVVVVDRFGNPVGDVPVAWEVTAGEGEVSEEQTRTGPDGRTSVVWELGGRFGIQKVTASIPDVTGSPVTFTATVLF
jgi:hypothetical protein